MLCYNFHLILTSWHSEMRWNLEYIIPIALISDNLLCRQCVIWLACLYIS
jgi:hypothetical protein